MPKEHKFKVTQRGEVVAEGSGTDIHDVHREAMHYAFQYAQDGPVEISFPGITKEEFAAMKSHLADDE